MVEEPNLPEVVINAIPKAILKLNENKSWESSHSLRNSIELWISSSWIYAQELNLSPEDYVEWMYLGYWNLAGDTGDFRLVSEYTKLAGSQGWALAKAGISFQEAVRLASEDGIEALIENAKVMSGLSGLHTEYEEEEIPAQNPKPEAKDFGIDFPSLD